MHHPRLKRRKHASQLVVIFDSGGNFVGSVKVLKNITILQSAAVVWRLLFRGICFGSCTWRTAGAKTHDEAQFPKQMPHNESLQMTAYRCNPPQGQLICCSWFFRIFTEPTKIPPLSKITTSSGASKEACAVFLLLTMGKTEPNANWSRHPFSKACLQHSQTVIQPCMWFMEEPAGSPWA